ncbi:MAG: hypothetical protein M0R17_04145 [Candidatus Omnitrophica bacterium]|jgi:hypothetical protein|nr:hypothetical protein [Candidatus Omnitrophota bacterium]
MGRPKKYTLNENYFNKIDTENKAYILGFIYADGSINRASNSFTVGLAAKDIEILEFIKSELKYSGSICHNKKGSIILTITSKVIKNDLIKLGIIPNKTYESKSLPTIDNNLISHMMRGFFDGDGSIYKTMNKKHIEYSANFTNNYNVLEIIKNWLYANNILSTTIRYRRGISNKFACMLDIKGNNNIEKLYKLFEINKYFSLSRKRNRFNEFIKHLGEINRQYDSNIIDLVISNYNQGYKQFEISKLLNIPYSSIRGIIQRARRDNRAI